MNITKKTQAKIDVVKEWVEENGQIWSRKVLYILVSAGLIKDTSKNRYIQNCKLFTRLRREGHIPYAWFRDKKTEVVGVGIGDSNSFGQAFSDLYHYFSKDSKSLQKNYVEVWTEKELPDPVIKLLDSYEVGLLTSEGFVGDVAQNDAVKRFRKIKQKCPNIEIKVFYITDYDCEGEHIYELMKDKFEEIGVEIVKLALLKTDIDRFNLISNVGYKDRMMKPRVLEHHLCKAYVKEFFDKNKDLTPDGIVQYELDSYPTPELIQLIEDTLDKLIDLEIIENTEEICRKEAKKWADEHYHGDDLE